MDFDLTWEAHPSYLRVRIRAVELGAHVTDRFLREAKDALIDTRLGHLLLEFELAHALSGADVFKVMQAFSPVMSGVRIAFVSQDSKQHPSLGFGVRVSQEFGQDYQYFKNIDAAQHWLTYAEFD